MDGQTIAWPHLVAPIEIKQDLAKHHKIALGQLSSRFTNILDQQPDRKFVIGAAASDSQIELVRMDLLDRTFYRSGFIPLNLGDKTSTGLDVLLRLVNSSCSENGYYPPEDISRRIHLAGVSFEFQTLLQKRKSDRGSFVASDIINGKGAVLKVPATDNECQILLELSRLQIKSCPRIISHGWFNDVSLERQYVLRFSFFFFF